jgi:rubrerythrin
MSLSTLLSELLPGSNSPTDAPESPSENGDDIPSVTVVYECRNCGTNVSAGTNRCPACEGDDIVSYSIE